MAGFKIMADPYLKHRDVVSSLSNRFELTVTDAARERKPVVLTKYTYEAVFGLGRRAAKRLFFVGNTDLPMTKALWDKDLLLEAVRFYGAAKELEDLLTFKNALSGKILYQAEGIFDAGFDTGFGGDEVYDQTGGWHE